MTDKNSKIPDYAELLKRTDRPAGSSWGVFGDDDELGMLNFLTPERIVAASSCIRRGATFNLDCTLDAFRTPVIPLRKLVRHRIFGNSVHQRDDYLDGFYLQSATQVDGLRHFRHPVHGFYNGTPDDRIAEGTPWLGMNRFAERAIAGRGVLIDVERHLAKRGERMDYRSAHAISGALVDEIAKAQGVEFRPGDILLLRTGWMKVYFEEFSEDERATFPKTEMRSPGLAQSHDTLAWIWDHQFGACASDNFALECHPATAGSTFGAELRATPGVLPRHVGLMHPFMIAMLGLMVGELWSLDALAEDCARDGVWECFVTVKPLNLVGGVGSPANALAIK
ncbi:MAG: cyclase family protein [Betaproteobacteria bacterium]|nr:cyclase family protein [Betaproteobacteria bacterium]